MVEGLSFTFGEEVEEELYVELVFQRPVKTSAESNWKATCRSVRPIHYPPLEFLFF
jgi:hypothetical protein